MINQESLTLSETELQRLEAVAIHILWEIYEGDPISFLNRYERVRQEVLERVYESRIIAS